MKKFSLGQLVYLVTDKEQEKRMVTAIIERVSGIEYELSCGTEVTTHFECELSGEEDVLARIG